MHFTRLDLFMIHTETSFAIKIQECWLAELLRARKYLDRNAKFKC